jgi:hypothetical protein
MKALPAVLLLVLPGIACDSPVVEKEIPPPPLATIGFYEDGGFKDFGLAVREVKENPGSLTVRAGANVDGRDVQVDVIVPDKWAESELGEGKDLTVRGGGLTLRRVGAASDSFVQLLAKHYGIKKAPVRMRESVDLAAVVLEGNPENLPKEPVKIKIFFNADSEREEEYGEAFLNIDLPRRLVQFNEKDPDYRAPIISALGR